LELKSGKLKAIKTRNEVRKDMKKKWKYRLLSLKRLLGAG